MPRAIGTANETSLHRQLKRIYGGRGWRSEIEIAGFVVDGINADGAYVEVQSGGFGRFAEKAKIIAALGSLKVIHPIIIAKYIEVFDAGGRELRRKKSPRSGSPWDLFRELVYAAELPLVPGLEIELALVDAAEERVLDGKGSWRRMGASVRDRRLIALRESIGLKTPADYLRFVPFARNEEFTSGALAKKAGIRVALARKTLYVLAKLGIAERIGKKGNALVYQLPAEPGETKLENNRC